MVLPAAVRVAASSGGADSCNKENECPRHYIYIFVGAIGGMLTSEQDRNQT